MQKQASRVCAGRFLLVVLVWLGWASNGLARQAITRQSQLRRYSKLAQPFQYAGLQDVSTTDDVLTDRFLVKLRPKNSSQSTVQSRAIEIVDSIRSAEVPVQLIHEFSLAWDGFSLQTDDVDGALSALEAEFEVLLIYPVVWLPAPDNKFDDINATALRGAYLVADASAATNGSTARLAAGGYKRLDGWGVKVGIIDTGVDYNHPALGGGFGSGFKVAYGRDFVGDAFRPGGVPRPDADPMDCAGHGTHVAGVIAGSWAGSQAQLHSSSSTSSSSNLTETETATSSNTSSSTASQQPLFSYQGVAPGVTLGAYKVFGCSGGTTSELVVAAMDQAALDGMQVINLSLGDEGAWGGPVAEAANRLSALGILVVAAAGNAGTSSGLFMQSAVASASSVIAVGAVQSYAAPVTNMTLRVLRSPSAAAEALEATGAAAAEAAATGNSSNVVSISVQAAFGDVATLLSTVVRPSAAAAAAGVAAAVDNATADGCDPHQLGDMTGVVALLAAGGCSIRDKVAAAAGQGALGVVLYGNDSLVDDVIRTPLLGSPGTWPSPSNPYEAPVLVVDLAAGLMLYGEYLAAAAMTSAVSPSPPAEPQPPSMAAWFPQQPPFDAFGPPLSPSIPPPPSSPLLTPGAQLQLLPPALPPPPRSPLAPSTLAPISPPTRPPRQPAESTPDSPAAAAAAPPMLPGSPGQESSQPPSPPRAFPSPAPPGPASQVSAGTVVPSSRSLPSPVPSTPPPRSAPRPPPRPPTTKPSPPPPPSPAPSHRQPSPTPPPQPSPPTPSAPKPPTPRPPRPRPPSPSPQPPPSPRHAPIKAQSVSELPPVYSSGSVVGTVPQPVTSPPSSSGNPTLLQTAVVDSSAAPPPVDADSGSVVGTGSSSSSSSGGWDGATRVVSQARQQQQQHHRRLLSGWRSMSGRGGVRPRRLGWAGRRQLLLQEEEVGGEPSEGLTEPERAPQQPADEEPPGQPPQPLQPQQVQEELQPPQQPQPPQQQQQPSPAQPELSVAQPPAEQQPPSLPPPQEPQVPEMPPPQLPAPAPLGRVSIMRPAWPRIQGVDGTLASAFSSWGPSPDLLLKPSLAAPGGAVLSTVPLKRSSDGAPSSGFAYRSGTSQAAPHVAAAAALFLQANKAREVTAAQVAAALLTTARPLFDLVPSSASTSTSTSSAAEAGNTTASSSTSSTATSSTTTTTTTSIRQPVSVIHVGGGVVDIAAMATNLVDLTPCKLELGSALAAGGNVSYTLEAVNRGSAPLAFRLLHHAAASLDASVLLKIDRSPGVAGSNNSRRAVPYLGFGASTLSDSTAEEGGVGTTTTGAAAAAAANAVTVTFMNSRGKPTENLTLPVGGKTRFRVNLQLSPEVAASSSSSLILSGYLLLEPIIPSAASSSSDPAVAAAALQPPLSLPYLGYSAPLISLPVLLPTLPGGITAPNGTWWWDEETTGYSVDVISPLVVVDGPPAEDEPPPSMGDAEPPLYSLYSVPPSPPVQPPLFSYALSGAGASLPSLALFIQRQPATQELWLYSETYGGMRLGYVNLQQQIVRKPTGGSPLVLTWRGTYYDLSIKREVNVSPGDYYFVVRMTRAAAAADSTTSGVSDTIVDLWRTPVFRLTRS
ncbi:hypothetical protein Agub_g11078 [Astrephomene gubernaculifera]|uniref:Peptidase S8/S53 domain-containing protein n=1 Tax=Astrephomene gubernaculifera TaxID=47775 RepID=A0AAD3DXM1_9CHLO|nr:hypothetical protein Agub_g11078 [Astrephomene gubernaculifera]